VRSAESDAIPATERVNAFSRQGQSGILYRQILALSERLEGPSAATIFIFCSRSIWSAATTTRSRPGLNSAARVVSRFSSLSKSCHAQDHRTSMSSAANPPMPPPTLTKPVRAPSAGSETAIRKTRRVLFPRHCHGPSATHRRTTDWISYPLVEAHSSIRRRHRRPATNSRPSEATTNAARMTYAIKVASRRTRGVHTRHPNPTPPKDRYPH